MRVTHEGHDFPSDSAVRSLSLTLSHSRCISLRTFLMMFAEQFRENHIRTYPYKIEDIFDTESARQLLRKTSRMRIMSNDDNDGRNNVRMMSCDRSVWTNESSDVEHGTTISSSLSSTTKDRPQNGFTRDTTNRFHERFDMHIVLLTLSTHKKNIRPYFFAVNLAF